jgi:ferredoxin
LYKGAKFSRFNWSFSSKYPNKYPGHEKHCQLQNNREVKMAFMITDDCINCGYCENECPNQAIYEPGEKWALADGTGLNQNLEVLAGNRVDPYAVQPALSDYYYFIVPEKCSECKGAYQVPQCLYVCPNPDSFVIHPEYNEKDSELMNKQFILNSVIHGL